LATTDEKIGYVKAKITSKWNFYKSRFHVVVSTHKPPVLLECLLTYLTEYHGIPNKELKHLDALAKALETFLELCPHDQWVIHEVKPHRPRDDRLFRAINIVRQEDGETPLTWTHLAFYIASRHKLAREEIENEISSWIDDEAVGDAKRGEYGTFVEVKPVRLLPDESVKYVNIPFSAILDRFKRDATKPSKKEAPKNGKEEHEEKSHDSR
jgi:DNA polymerase III epsilon subunit-like protein